MRGLPAATSEPSSQTPTDFRRTLRALTVIYQDDALLVVNKPTLLSSIHDAARPDEPDLLSLLEERYGELLPVHRLDRDTSGVILFARNARAHVVLSTMFEAREVEKTYHALVVGVPRWETRTIEAPLRADGDRKHRTVVDVERGKPAVTHFRVLVRMRQHTLLEAKPETGRTHQIRVHSALAGYPLVADPLYGDGKPIFLSAFKRDYRQNESVERPLISRTALHALRLRLSHPTTGETLVFEAPYPKDFSAVVNQLARLS